MPTYELTENVKRLSAPGIELEADETIELDAAEAAPHAEALVEIGIGGPSDEESEDAEGE